MENRVIQRNLSTSSEMRDMLENDPMPHIFHANLIIGLSEKIKLMKHVEF